MSNAFVAPGWPNLADAVTGWLRLPARQSGGIGGNLPGFRADFPDLGDICPDSAARGPRQGRIVARQAPGAIFSTKNRLFSTSMSSGYSFAPSPWHTHTPDGHWVYLGSERLPTGTSHSPYGWKSSRFIRYDALAGTPLHSCIPAKSVSPPPCVQAIRSRIFPVLTRSWAAKVLYTGAFGGPVVRVHSTLT